MRSCVYVCSCVAAGAIPNLVLQHPRIFEYRWEDEDCPYLVKGRARIQVRTAYAD